MSPAHAHTDRERAAALAGVFQAARLVTRVARHGDAPTGALEASLASVLQLDAESVTGTVRPGDRIFLYTDGLGQGVGGGFASGEAWRAAFAEALAACSGLPLDLSVSELSRRLLGSAAPKDDVLLLGLAV